VACTIETVLIHRDLLMYKNLFLILQAP
jgi:hypothetical protein